MAKEGFDYFYPTSTARDGRTLFSSGRAHDSWRGSSSRGRAAIERRIPFKNVYFTGIIRDQQAARCSKSLGKLADRST